MKGNPIMHVCVKIPSDREIAEQRLTNYWAGLEPEVPYRVVNDYEKLVSGRSIHFLLIVDSEGMFKEIPAESAYIVYDAEGMEPEFGRHLNG